MIVPAPHAEQHYINRTGWLRAAVLGANDGVISTAGLIVGVAAAAATREGVLLVGAAGLVAGAMSMAAGEYVSVSAQRDTENADIAIEKRALTRMPEAELAELAAIYETRGLDPALAREVAEALTAKNALDAHKRDELGITESLSARPIMAAGSSALAFALGAGLPLAAAALAPAGTVAPVVVAASLASLAILGLASAKAGGAKKARAVLRVVFWGAVAMGVTHLAGSLFGAVA